MCSAISLVETGLDNMRSVSKNENAEPLPSIAKQRAHISDPGRFEDPHSHNR